MDFVLYEGRAEIAAETEKLMQAMLDRYGTGVSIRKVTLQNTQPPEQVQAAFDDAVKASQDLERQKNEGQAYANNVVPLARGMASRLLQEADGYNASVVQRAEGDASRFRQVLVEYSKAPGVTRERLYLDMMQSVLGNSSKVLIDQKGSNSLLYLPLDQLLKQTQAANGSAAGVDARATPATPEASVTLDPTHSRELPRGRDRDTR
jgi:membrane protease subunit HflK